MELTSPASERFTLSITYAQYYKLWLALISHKNFHALHFFELYLSIDRHTVGRGLRARARMYVCTCLLCVCTNDIDVRVCVIVRNRNSVRGRALRSKGGSNEIDTSALDSPLLFFFSSFYNLSLPPSSLGFSYFLHSPSNDYEPREDPC